MRKIIPKSFSLKPYFQTKTPTGINIRTTVNYWNRIIQIKHSTMEGKEKEVKETLELPDEIRVSKSDKKVFLYYRKINRYYICVVVKHLNGEGFIITAYKTRQIIEGEKIWTKKITKKLIQ